LEEEPLLEDDELEDDPLFDEEPLLFELLEELLVLLEELPPWLTTFLHLSGLVWI